MEQPPDLSCEIDMEEEQGVFSLNESRPSSTLFPLSATKAPAHIYVRDQFGDGEIDPTPPADVPAGSSALHRAASLINKQVAASDWKKTKTSGKRTTGEAAGKKAYEISKETARKVSKDVLRVMEDSLKGCTFSPAIGHSRLPRRFDGFLQEQKERQKRREEAVAEKKKEREQAEAAVLQHSPKICEVLWIAEGEVELEGTGKASQGEERRLCPRPAPRLHREAVRGGGRQFGSLAFFHMVDVPPEAQQAKCKASEEPTPENAECAAQSAEQQLWETGLAESALGGDAQSEAQQRLATGADPLGPQQAQLY